MLCGLSQTVAKLCSVSLWFELAPGCTGYSCLRYPQWSDVLEQKLPGELKLVCAFCSENADQAAEVYNLQKITLLREISLKTGVQVRSTCSLPCHHFCTEEHEEYVQCVLQAQREPPKVLCGVHVGIQVPALRRRFVIQFPLRVNLLAWPLEEQLASVQLHCLLTPLWAVGQQLDELSCLGFSVVTMVPFCHVQLVVHTYI